MHAAAVFLLGILLSTPAPADVKQAMQSVIDDGDYQTKHPDPPELIPLDAPGGAGEGREVRRTRRDQWRRPGRPPTSSSSSDGSWSSGGSDIARALGYVLVVVVLALLAAWLVRQATGFRADEPGAEPETVVDSMTAAPAVLEGLRDEAEALANDGRYSEAIHVLLLKTIERLAARAPVAPSSTSRELEAELGLEGAARAAFGALVGAVELSLFGGRDPDRAAYEACRGHFDAFRRALGEARA